MNCSIRRMFLAAGRCAARFVRRKDTSFAESLWLSERIASGALAFYFAGCKKPRRAVPAATRRRQTQAWR
jgi:hypothetical protein